MTVVNNGTNKTEEYKANKTVTVAANTRGSFGNLYFTRPADTAVYYYSANMNILNDTSNYGSVRFVLGYGNIGDVKKYIEVCYRPGINQIVAFLNGNGETPLYVGGGYNFAYAQEYRCTAVYDCGKISFWVNGILNFNGTKINRTDFCGLKYSGGYYINAEARFYDNTYKN